MQNAMFEIVHSSRANWKKQKWRQETVNVQNM